MSRKIFVIPHFHYDVAWWKTERAYLRQVYKIIRKVLNLLDTDDQFRYLLDQTYYLEKLKETKPRLFRRVAEQVAEGRIEIVNAGYTMADLNLVSPHTLTKAYSLANEFAQREFGVKPKVAWMIDCFGHHGLMPRIARQAGLDYYVFWRGMDNPKLSQDFIWQGVDGTSILTHWLRGSYSLFGRKGKNLEAAIRQCKPTTQSVFIPMGGDFYEPEAELIDQVHRMPEAQFATPTEYFQQIERFRSNLPTVRGEMLSDHRNFRGVYSSRIRYKQLFRKAEMGLIDHATQASDQDWKDLIYGAFHDLICGSAVDKVYRPTRHKLNELISRFPHLTDEKPKEPYSGKFLSNIRYELRLDGGDLYHTRPGPWRTRFNAQLESHLLEGGPLELDVRVSFRHPHHRLQLIIKTDIPQGVLTHYLDGYPAKRKLNTLYAFTGPFEYWNRNRTAGLRLSSDDCFDYEVKSDGHIHLTLVRSVLFLSRGDAGPILPCPGALERGRHRFKIHIYPLGQREWL